MNHLAVLIKDARCAMNLRCENYYYNNDKTLYQFYEHILRKRKKIYKILIEGRTYCYNEIDKFIDDYKFLKEYQ